MRGSHLAYGAVGLQEVGLEEGIKEVAGDPLNAVVNGQHVDALAVLDVGALQDAGSVTSSNSLFPHVPLGFQGFAWV